MKQDMVDYRVAQEGEPGCANCENFQLPNSCAVVSGVISPQGMCDLFQQNTANLDVLDIF